MQIVKSQKVASYLSKIDGGRRAIVALITFSNRDAAGNDASVTAAQLDLVLAKIRAELETYGVEVGASAGVATFPATELSDGETARLQVEATFEILAPDSPPETDDFAEDPPVEPEGKAEPGEESPEETRASEEAEPDEIPTSEPEESNGEAPPEEPGDEILEVFEE